MLKAFFMDLPRAFSIILVRPETMVYLFAMVFCFSMRTLGVDTICRNTEGFLKQDIERLT